MSVRANSEEEAPQGLLSGLSPVPGWWPALALLSLAYLLHAATALGIGAFNIRTFGDTDMSNETVAGIIVNIVRTYDIIVVQEVRDADLSAVRKLMDQLNRVSLHPYGFEVSKPLGRGSYKEQYLFIYRTDAVSVVDSYYYDDGCEPCGNDTFSREPFIVKFSSPSTEVREFVLVPLHTPPSEAVPEIDALYDVYLDVIDKWGTDSIFFLGDFNADCSYVGPQDRPSIRLCTSGAFRWLIPDSANTTVLYSDCAYDWIVVSGPELQRLTGTHSAKVNNFSVTFHLQLKDALAVSDHFPVEVTLTAR
ncbi:deoxyribonuclease-1-like [Carettochelys insculpta]|uniref:deoxyribonuclease-1-like n=1 Tax=Carettochelys insculpta TaxID=44489 RepID=UPI003EBE6CA3